MRSCRLAMSLNYERTKGEIEFLLHLPNAQVVAALGDPRITVKDVAAVRAGNWKPDWIPTVEKPSKFRPYIAVEGGYGFVTKEPVGVLCEVATKDVKAAKPEKPDLATTDLAEDLDRTSDTYWRKRCHAVEGKLTKLLEAESVTQRLTNDIQSLAPKSYDPAPPNFLQPKNVIDTSPQSAVLLFSDTHIGKTVTPDQTLSFGEYNMQVFLDRLQLLQDATVNIASTHVSSPIEELVVVMIGDMLDGGLFHGNEIDQTVSKFGQFYAGGHAIAQCFRALAARFPRLRIETCVGNHTRWGEQRKMPTKYRFSNLDMFLYAYVQSLTSDIDNIHWNLNQQPFQRFEVQTSSFFAAHGDHLRGGDKALGIPSHALNRQLSNISQLLDKQDISNPDYYVYGHFHRSMQLPHTRGKIFVNGAFPGVDEYALTNNFVMSDPEQTLMLVHPKYKAADNWPIQLKFAEPGSSRYVLPQHFD